MTRMTTPRLLEWFRKARKVYEGYEPGSEESIDLAIEMATAKVILGTRGHVTRKD